MPRAAPCRRRTPRVCSERLAGSRSPCVGWPPLTTMRRLEIAALLTVPFGLGLVACLATEADPAKMLADNIHWAQTGCRSYMADPKIPRRPELDRYCPLLLDSPPELDDAMVSEDAAGADAGSVPLADSGTTSDAGSLIHTSQGNALRSVQ